MVQLPSLNVSILGEDVEKRASAAHSFGKKGTADDMAFYHTVFQGKIVSVIDPLAYPKKLSPLLQALNLTDYAMVLADQVSPTFGEIVVALDLFGLNTVFVSQLDLNPFIGKTSLANCKVFDNVDDAKNHLLAMESPRKDGDAIVFVDHCFDVKGVGTVVLGMVKQGEVKVHDKLVAYPLGQEIEVRSIQMNDQDVQTAHSGDRIGFSLKGAKAGEIDRGTVLSAKPVKSVKEFECDVAVSKFSKIPLSNDAVIHFCAGLQFEPAKIQCNGIKPGESGRAKFSCDKPVALTEDKLLLCDINSKGLRVIGSAKVV